MGTEAMATEFQGMLEARGVTRRSFMKLCGAIAVAAGLGELAAPRVAQAPESASAQIFREMALRAAGAVALLGKDYSAKMPPVRPLERK